MLSGGGFSPIADEGVITVLAMGQSNSLGWQAGGEWSFPAGVTAWDNLNGVTDLSLVGSQWAQPSLGANPFKSDGSNNPMIHACKSLHERTGRPVRLVLVSKGGQQISMWSDGSVKGPLYARMQSVLAAAGVKEVDAFLWHQGEADNPAPETYGTKFESLLGFLRSDGYLPRGTPVVIGTPVNTFTSIIPVLEQIATTHPEIALADISNLAVGADNIHFTGESLVTAGGIYGGRLAELMRV